MTDQLSMWVVYDHPSDQPDAFIARRWLVTGTGTGEPQATLDEILGDTIDDLYSQLHKQHPGLTRLPRAASDDAVIVESWI